MSHPEPAIRLSVDPTNPGQFLACCGVLELANRLWTEQEAEGWFEGGAFCVTTNGHLRELLLALVREPAKAVTQLDNGLAVKPLIAPLRLTITPEVTITLDAWMTIKAEKGEVVTAANPPWNFWSGQQTSLRIWTPLRKAMKAQLVEDVEGGTSEAIFSQRVALTGRFGFDPGAAWTALDVGFSPDAQDMPVATSPATELLAAVGLQRFRPVLSKDRDFFYYGTWGRPLAPSVAAAAASSLVVVPPSSLFRGKVVSRGVYAALGYSTLLERNT